MALSRLFAASVALVGLACVSPQRADRSAARVDLGTAYLKESNAAGAIAVLQEAARLDSRSWNAWNKLGLAYLAQGAFDESEAAFKRSLRLDPPAEAYNNYGFMLMKKGEYEAAVAQFERALEDLTYRRTALAMSNLGNALYKLKRYEEAIVRLSGAIDRAPNMCEPRINRGLSYVELGKRREALDDFEVVIDLCGDSSTGAYYQAAQLLMESGDRTAACSYLRKAMGDAGGTQLGVAASDLHARACL